MKYYKLTIITLILSLWTLLSCETFDTEVTIPSYLKVDSVKVQTNESVEGTYHQQISDVWVNINGTKIGTFEIPSRFPILQEGSTPISIQAGIIKSGIHDFREIYPFFKTYRDTLYLQKGKSHFVTPIFQYKKETNFLLIEDFEDAGMRLYPIDTIDYSETIEDPDYTDNHIRKISLPDSVIGFQMITRIPIILKTKPIYMEIEYKCNETFGVGIKVQQATGSYSFEDPFTIIKPQSNWNKMYLNIAEQMYLTTGNNYDIYLFFKSEKGKISTFYIDNIKIITFDE